ncbi:MAG: tRNA (adenosine(37)-N6)-threonylcarbamoyltransferase complex ATPase subunit type 1 TsaE [Caldilineaceae bacterium]|nr:tRNA (adenosine(37)-N6)-threonylcarbamoyltransferase complex ATPase subunit type 1 TsaE [Caldilineaceae bacterium]
MVTYQTETTTPAATFALGQQLGQWLVAGQMIALHGELGAGKTLLTQGIAAGLGIQQRVTSPTFTLVSEYARPNRERLIHMDSYRLGSPTAQDGALEAAFLGLEEILDQPDAIVIIEWAERVASLLPADHLSITLTYAPETPEKRQIYFQAYGPLSARLLEQLVQAT